MIHGLPVYIVVSETQWTLGPRSNRVWLFSYLLPSRIDIVLVLFTYDPLFEKSAQNELYTQAARRLGTIPDDWMSIMDCTIE